MASEADGGGAGAYAPYASQVENCVGRHVDRSASSSASTSQVAHHVAAGEDYIPVSGASVVRISRNRALVTGGVARDGRAIPFSIVRPYDCAPPRAFSWVRACEIKKGPRQPKPTVPVPREDHTLTLDPTGKFLLLIGGRRRCVSGGGDGGGRASTDGGSQNLAAKAGAHAASAASLNKPCGETLYGLRLEEDGGHTWEEIATRTASARHACGPRFAHSASLREAATSSGRRARAGGAVYVYGGYSAVDAAAPLSTVHRLTVVPGSTRRADQCVCKWELGRRRGGPGTVAPPPRACHAAVFLNDRYLVVHGGKTGAASSTLGDFCDDLFLYDAETGCWRAPLDEDPYNAHHRPSARAYHCAVLGIGEDEGHVVFFGGQVRSGDHSDEVFRMRLTPEPDGQFSVTWTKRSVSPPGCDYGLSRCGVVPFPDANLYVVIGGKGRNGPLDSPIQIEPFQVVAGSDKEAPCLLRVKDEPPDASLAPTPTPTPTPTPAPSCLRAPVPQGPSPVDATASSHGHATPRQSVLPTCKASPARTLSESEPLQPAPYFPEGQPAATPTGREMTPLALLTPGSARVDSTPVADAGQEAATGCLPAERSAAPDRRGGNARGRDAAAERAVLPRAKRPRLQSPGAPPDAGLRGPASPPVPAPAVAETGIVPDSRPAPEPELETQSERWFPQPGGGGGGGEEAGDGVPGLPGETDEGEAAPGLPAEAPRSSRKESLPAESASPYLTVEELLAAGEAEAERGPRGGARARGASRGRGRGRGRGVDKHRPTAAAGAAATSALTAELAEANFQCEELKSQLQNERASKETHRMLAEDLSERNKSHEARAARLRHDLERAAAGRTGEGDAARTGGLERVRLERRNEELREEVESLQRALDEAKAQHAREVAENNRMFEEGNIEQEETLGKLEDCRRALEAKAESHASLRKTVSALQREVDTQVESAKRRDDVLNRADEEARTQRRRREDAQKEERKAARERDELAAQLAQGTRTVADLQKRRRDAERELEECKAALADAREAQASCRPLPGAAGPPLRVCIHDRCRKERQAFEEALSAKSKKIYKLETDVAERIRREETMRRELRELSGNLKLTTASDRSATGNATRLLADKVGLEAQLKASKDEQRQMATLAAAVTGSLLSLTKATGELQKKSEELVSRERFIRSPARAGEPDAEADSPVERATDLVPDSLSPADKLVGTGAAARPAAAAADARLDRVALVVSDSPLPSGANDASVGDRHAAAGRRGECGAGGNAREGSGHARPPTTRGRPDTHAAGAAGPSAPEGTAAEAAAVAAAPDEEENAVVGDAPRAAQTLAAGAAAAADAAEALVDTVAVDLQASMDSDDAPSP